MTAWFAPLPPKPKWKSRPVRVSPGRGKRGVRNIRSMLDEPTTQMRGMSAMLRSLSGTNCGASNRLPLYINCLRDSKVAGILDCVANLALERSNHENRRAQSLGRRSYGNQTRHGDVPGEGESRRRRDDGIGDDVGFARRSRNQNRR